MTPASRGGPRLCFAKLQLCFWTVVISSLTCHPCVQGESRVPYSEGPNPQPPTIHHSSPSQSWTQYKAIFVTPSSEFLSYPHISAQHVQWVAKFWPFLPPLGDLSIHRLHLSSGIVTFGSVAAAASNLVFPLLRTVSKPSRVWLPELSFHCAIPVLRFSTYKW